MKILVLQRNSYTDDTTIGELFDESHKHFGYTLEDTVRAEGIKVKHNTAIPATGNEMVYKLGIRNSPKYGEVVVIYTEREGEVYKLTHKGVSFSYILIHGGNDHGDTSGCVLLAKNITGRENIQGSLKTAIKDHVKKLIEEGHEVGLRIINMPQSE